MTIQMLQVNLQKNYGNNNKQTVAACYEMLKLENLSIEESQVMQDNQIPFDFVYTYQQVDEPCYKSS